MLKRIIAWACEMEEYAYNFYLSNGENELAEEKRNHLEKLKIFFNLSISLSEEEIIYLESIYLRFLKEKNEKDFPSEALSFEKDFILFYNIIGNLFPENKIFRERLEEGKKHLGSLLCEKDRNATR